MATRSFFALGNNLGAGVSANNTFEGSVHGKSNGVLASTSRSYYQYRAAVPFTWSNLRIVNGTTSNGSGRYIAATLNETDQSMTAALPDGALSLGQSVVDSTNSLSVAAGDKVGLKLVRGAGTMLITGSSVISAPGNQAVSPMLATGSLTWTALTNRRSSISGTLINASNLGYELTGLRVTADGDFRGLFAYVSANASTGAAVGTIEARVSGVNSGLKLDVGVGETGYFFENTTVVPVADGDFVDLDLRGTTGNAITVTAVGATLVSDSRAFDVHDYHGRSFTTANSAAGIYLGITGGDPGSTAPASRLPFMEYVVEFPLRVSRFSGYFVSTLDAAMTVDVLVDGAASGITFDVPAGYAGGTLSDDVHSVDLAVGQKVALRAQPTGAAPTTGNFAWYTHSLRFEDLTPGFKPKITWHG